ncbi:hypothetical protein LCGC14_1333080 [marine sediment metagenome]|uniref:Uncharacterized protein n=1 Tax=marine sediment metagenome TaxID=412755 RepID=A0A0F9KGM9_9ZZZZ
MKAPRYLLHTACDALSMLKAHHEALGCDIEPEGKTADPCEGCAIIIALEKAIVRGASQRR